MTSSAAAAAAAAAELARDLSPHEQLLNALKNYADWFGVKAVVVNRLTRLELLITHMLRQIIQILDGFLQTISKLETLTEKQHALYRELMVLKNTIVLYEFCKNDSAKMLQWVRGFSELFLVETAMTQYALDEARKNGASQRKLEAIRAKKRFFCGHTTKLHILLRNQPWSNGSKITLNLGVLSHQIIKMARWARVEMDKKNDDVDDLLFQARLDNLREDPLKLTGI